MLKKKLNDVDLIIYHNAYFDRNFMELQTTQDFSDLIKILWLNIEGEVSGKVYTVQFAARPDYVQFWDL